MSEELKPTRILLDIDKFHNCPLCNSKIDASIIGGLEKIHRSGSACSSDPADITLFCPHCGIQFGPFPFTQEGINNAVIIWNNRAEPGELPDWLKEKLNRVLGNKFLTYSDWRTHWNDAIEWILSLKRGEDCG